MRVIYTIADLQPESGGPSRSVCALAGAVSTCGIEADILALEYGQQAAPPLRPSGVAKASFVPCRGHLGRTYKWSAQFQTALRSLCPPDFYGVLHDNGLWLPTNISAARIARSLKIPFLISPRGMLTPWSLRFHGFRKRIAWMTYQKGALLTANVLHATSGEEAQVFRSLGLNQPIAVIPNGVELPPALHHDPTGDGETARIALFLSRVHPKKGLLDLVQAWSSARPTGWRVIVAGGDENNHRAEVERAAREQGLADQFQFMGEIADDQKWELYRKASLFVLPSKSENFGIVIAEALACGVPVITTRATPWQELETRRCGWWVETGVTAVADALREATSLTDEELRERGARGQKLIEENYTWPAAARRMVATYRWMLGEADKPSWVMAE